MSKYAKENGGTSFVLVVINIFSKFLWIRPSEDRKGQSDKWAFEDILQESRHSARLHTDKGQEFRSRIIKNFPSDRNIDHLYAQNTEVKANYVKRVIKRIKAKLYISPLNNFISTLTNFKILPNYTVQCNIP